MDRGRWVQLAAAAALMFFASCDSDRDSPSAPAASASVSGTVVYASTGTPVPGVDVTIERCADGRTMMHNDWEDARQMMTDHNGQFHFEYMHDPEHRYRVRAGGMNPDGMCYLEGGVEDGVVLKISAP